VFFFLKGFEVESNNLEHNKFKANLGLHKNC